MASLIGVMKSDVLSSRTEAPTTRPTVLQSEGHYFCDEHCREEGVVGKRAKINRVFLHLRITCEH